MKAKAEELPKVQKELDLAVARTDELDRMYRDEQILRKKYWNMVEDMKGKIRVYARARPMSDSELERGNYSIANFPDQYTIELDAGSKGKKQFLYDNCYPPNTTQEAVWQDTENLVQSAFDGYNVAIFAYGQTGSGKTHTMQGAPDIPGVTPRAIRKLFDIIDKTKEVFDVTVQAYMVELYMDNLIDLFWRVDNPRERAEPPKLEIKKDDKGLVMVKGADLKQCKSAEEVLELFDAGNGVRHTGATNMNAASSRSHLVFALIVDATSRKTKKTSTGKLSLIDLAGSERASKTGATTERLKEAQSINKSLSALGNVISALSTNEKFVPYRDNKLTQLMSDSLGGNAKTLMFVNLSPADYNIDESLSSLIYASRVKLITNSAEKMQESAEVARLKKIIAQFKAGVTPTDLDAADIDDTRSPLDDGFTGVGDDEAASRIDDAADDEDRASVAEPGSPEPLSPRTPRTPRPSTSSTLRAGSTPRTPVTPASTRAIPRAAGR